MLLDSFLRNIKCIKTVLRNNSRLMLNLIPILFPSSFQVHGPIRRDEHARDGGHSGRDGLDCQVDGDAAHRAAKEAQGALLAGAGLRAGAALQAAEVPVGAGEGAPGRTDPPHPQPGKNLVPEPPLQTEAAGQGQERAAAAGARRKRGCGRRSVRGDPSILTVSSPLQERQGVQRAQPHGKPTEQLRGGLDCDPATAAGAGEPALIPGGTGGFVPESAARSARTDQHDADGRSADRVHERHDRLQFTVREDVVAARPAGLTASALGRISEGSRPPKKQT